MNPYSHLVVAAHFEERFQPSSRAEYYWGAIAPDARYPAAPLNPGSSTPRLARNSAINAAACSSRAA